MLAKDVDFWKMYRESNAWGHFSVVSPQVKANSEISREITVFNDVISVSKLLFFVE